VRDDDDDDDDDDVDYAEDYRDTRALRRLEEDDENDRAENIDDVDDIDDAVDEEARQKRRRVDFAEEFAARSGCVSKTARASANPPATLALEYWTRSEELTEKKRAHIDKLDDEFGYYGVEEHIERTVLHGADVAIEVNMFPYECPAGVTHHTLWSRKEMDGEEIMAWTCAWLRKHLPRCTKWNFDLNENHSVDVPHYHVFTYEPPLLDEDVDANKI
jgi:hypothetical protein